MEHDKRRAETLREIDRLKRLFHRALAFLLVGRGKLIAIGRRSHDFDRQWAKIVQTAKANLASLEKFLHARHE